VRPTRGTVRIGGRVGALLELGAASIQTTRGARTSTFERAHGPFAARDEIEVDAIVDFADIGPHIDEPIKHYSSGMAVRLGFAVATALTPDILITDEVLAVGDESFQKKCIQWLEQYLTGGGTLLLCSHSMFHVQTLCRQALWIHHGRARMHGNAFDVTREYLTYHEKSGATRRRRPSHRSMGRGSRRRGSRMRRGPGRSNSKWARHRAAGDHSRARRSRAGADGRHRARRRHAGYGTHSNDTASSRGASNVAVSLSAFGCARRCSFPQVHDRAFALDAEGLRLFHSVKIEVVIRGDTRDYGVARLAHEWLPGREAPRRASSRGARRIAAPSSRPENVARPLRRRVPPRCTMRTAGAYAIPASRARRMLRS